MCDHDERNCGSVTDIRRRRRNTVHIILISESTCFRFIRATLDSSVAVAPAISQSRRNALGKRYKNGGQYCQFFLPESDFASHRQTFPDAINALA